MPNWDNWLQDNTFKKLLEKMVTFYDKKSEADPFTDYFTPHDSSHCRAVEKLVKALVNKSGIQSILSDLEKFVLFSCVWTHDIGMLTNVAQSILGSKYSTENKRKTHEIIGAEYLSTDEFFLKLFADCGINENLSRCYINTINLVNKFHRRQYSINSCPETRYIKGKTIKARLLASLVRLADTLHIDTTRYDRKRYDILQIGNFDRTSRLHWLKSYVVSSVYLDIDKQTIFITLDLPEPQDQALTELEENAENLKSIIYEDVYEDVAAVQNVFRENNLPFYSLANVEINYVPGIERSRALEILGIINDLHIVLSPSTSKVIRKSLDSIQSLSEIQFTIYEHFHNQVEQLIDHLDRIHQDRPCHVGLKRIINLVESEFDKFPKKNSSVTTDDIKEIQGKLLVKITKIRRLRDDSIRKISEQSKDKLKGINNIFLFGLSEMVTKFLASSSNEFKNSVNIFVFECGSKRQFSPSNNLEYNDGLYYAIMLSNSGFKNINVLPDNSFCSLVEDLSRNITKDNSVLFFGANGIEENRCNCGHSSGHKMMAIVAKHYGIAVKIISDSFKIGTIAWDPSLQRKGYWVTGQSKWLNELYKRNIGLTNYREDKIPYSLIDDFIIDDTTQLSCPDM